MTEPVIVCPSCSYEIKLTQSLAAPLVEEAKRGFEAKLRAKDAEIGEREKELVERVAALDEEKARLEDVVGARSLRRARRLPPRKPQRRRRRPKLTPRTNVGSWRRSRPSFAKRTLSLLKRSGPRPMRCGRLVSSPTRNASSS